MVIYQLLVNEFQWNKVHFATNLNSDYISMLFLGIKILLYGLYCHSMYICIYGLCKEPLLYGHAQLRMRTLSYLTVNRGRPLDSKQKPSKRHRVVGDEPNPHYHIRH